MAAGVYEPIRPTYEVLQRGTVSIPEAASQTFKVGAPLVFSSGYLQEASAGPSTVSYIAAEDGHNGGSNGTYNIACWKIMSSDVYEISFEDAHAVTDYGNVFGIVKDATSGYWYADSGDSNDQALVVSVKSTPTLGNVGDTKFRGYVKFQTANIASD